MAIFAKIEKGIVTDLIVAEQKFIDSGAVGDPKQWIETAMDGSIRKNYARIGDTFDEKLDAFVAPRKFNSWTLDEQKAKWVPPMPKPNVDSKWDENTGRWVQKRPVVTKAEVTNIQLRDAMVDEVAVDATIDEIPQ